MHACIHTYMCAPGMEGGRPSDQLNEELLLRIFKAKCLDLKLTPTEERRERFFELVKKNSSHGRLSLRETGLGILGAAAVAALLIQVHMCLCTALHEYICYLNVYTYNAHVHLHTLHMCVHYMYVHITYACV
jgi:hypothetical protein